MPVDTTQYLGVLKFHNPLEVTHESINNQLLEKGLYKNVKEGSTVMIKIQNLKGSSSMIFQYKNNRWVNQYVNKV